MFAKMLILVASVTFVLSTVFIPLSVYAEGHEADELATALKNFENTGKIKNCVRLRNVRTSKVIDDYNILFLMKGKKAYLNTLNHRCSRLGSEGSFSYSVSQSQLCDFDIISVFDAHGNNTGGFCGLGKFVEYEKKPEAETKISQH